MQKNIIVLVAVALIALVVGYGIAAVSAPKVDVEALKKEISQKTINSLQQKLNSKIQKGLIPFPGLMEEFSAKRTFISGELTAVDAKNNVIKVKVANPYRGGSLFDYLDEPDYYVKTVKIDKETAVVKREMKTPEQLEKERKGTPKEAMEEGMPYPYIVPPYQETEIAIKDLKQGLTVSVESETEFELKSPKTITAKKIMVTGE